MERNLIAFGAASGASADEENPDDDDEHFDGQTALAYCRDIEQVISTGLFTANGISELEIDSDGDPRNYVTGTGHYYLSTLKAPNGPFSYVARNIFFPNEGANHCDVIAGNSYKALDKKAAIGHLVQNWQDLGRVLSEVSNSQVFMASREIELRLEEELPQVVKSPVPFLKNNYQFIVESEGKYKARRSPKDQFKSYTLEPLGIDQAPNELERVEEEWYHRSATLSARRTALTPKEGRSQLRKKPFEKEDESEESSESQEESSEEVAPSRRGKRKRSDNDTVLSRRKRPKKTLLK